MRLMADRKIICAACHPQSQLCMRTQSTYHQVSGQQLLTFSAKTSSLWSKKTGTQGWAKWQLGDQFLTALPGVRKGKN